MLSQRGKPLLVHDGYSFGIQYIRKDKKYWQCNLSRKYNCKARVTTTDAGDIIVTNNEHCHTEIRQHLRKDYKMNKLQQQLNSQFGSHNMNFHLADRKINLAQYIAHPMTTSSTLTSVPSISTTQTSIMPRQNTTTNSFPKNLSIRSRSPSMTPSPSSASQQQLNDSNDIKSSPHD
ncbi:hypothetical protein PVAND_005301 [Polypedilum vanderplanki]|uniref:FLYWCH-type domain-containing protein n=1 Tax=Polypedilum vanderplanki TaxID=319348 RepID=A0A9J6BZI9_POLVA|nr:hypothetical protein PVAND_005301 [Polypedilum vanderplanki]